MAFFRSKPVVKEAIQFTGGNQSEIMIWCGDKILTDRHRLFVSTLEGSMEAKPSDWIIKGLAGEFYPCRDDIFKASYEPLSAGL